MLSSRKIHLIMVLLFLTTVSILLFLVNSFTARETRLARERAIDRAGSLVKTSFETRTRSLLEYGQVLSSGWQNDESDFPPLPGITSLLFETDDKGNLILKRSRSLDPALAKEVRTKLAGMKTVNGPVQGVLNLTSGPRLAAILPLPRGKTLVLTRQFVSEEMARITDISGLSIKHLAPGFSPDRTGANLAEKGNPGKPGYSIIRDVEGNPVFQVTVPPNPELAKGAAMQTNFLLLCMLAALFPAIVTAIISRISEHQYRSLFERSPIALWEEDFSAIHKRLDALASQGVKDLAGYLEDHPDILEEMTTLPRIRRINGATVSLYGGQDKKDIRTGHPQLFSNEGTGLINEVILAIARGEATFEGEGINYGIDGRKLHVQMRWIEVPGRRRRKRALFSVENISERKAVENRLRFLSFHDPLTGVNNRVFFEEQLHSLDSPDLGSLGVLTLDVDGLKLVNDSLGHKAGDELLRRTGATLKRSFRSTDILARIGGDEFVIFLPQCSFDGLQSALHRLETEVLRDLPTPSCPTPLCFSVGWAWGGEDRPPVKELIARADRRMYDQKTKGRSQMLQRVRAHVRNTLNTDMLDATNREGLLSLLSSLQQALTAVDRGLPVPRI